MDPWREWAERIIADLARATGKSPDVIRLEHPLPDTTAGDAHRTRYLRHRVPIYNPTGGP